MSWLFSACAVPGRADLFDFAASDHNNFDQQSDDGATDQGVHDANLSIDQTINPPVDLTVPGVDGLVAYADLGQSDSGLCKPPNVGALCETPIAPGCLVEEVCGTNGVGNGLDDNCDGQVDETCSCNPGDVQRCFLGPPGHRGIGACQDGLQTCQGLEFGSWGPCKGGISPQAEGCDSSDNDCNGCADDGLCCGGILTCPAKVPDIQPFTTVNYDGSTFFSGEAATWSWTIEGGPCDQLFKTTTGDPPTQTYTFTGVDTSTVQFRPTLSGDYTITMTVVDKDGKTYSCKWIQHVIGPGLRVELCWDHTGTWPDGSDLDLHLHRPGTTSRWFNSNPKADGCSQFYSSTLNPDDCNLCNCKADIYAGPRANWGYSSSPLAACIGGPQGPTWQSNFGFCPNPRLDIDNRFSVGVPENINVDKPENGAYRVMVHYYYSAVDFQSPQVYPLEQHPIVNIYCGGHLKATYGQAPNTLGPCPGPTCFDRGNGWNKGLMWRVADVTPKVDGNGNTTDCTVAPIHPAGSNKGYSVTNNDLSY